MKAHRHDGVRRARRAGRGARSRRMPLDCVLLGMKLTMPLVTLLTGLALGVGVLIASMLSPASAAPANGYGATSAAPAAGAVKPASGSPPPGGGASAAAPASTSATTPAATK